LKAIPGILSVGGAAAGSPPLIAAGFEGGSSATRLRVPGAADAEFVLAEFNRVTPDYLATAGIPLLRGRTFADSEMAAADLSRTSTVVLDQLAARQLFGDHDVYAVMSSLVAQRTREIGVRMAVGATPRRILWTVVGQIGRYLAIGLAAGLPAAWAVSRAFGGLFFEVRPTDLWIYATVAVILTTVGLGAALLPARRASTIDPLVALRAE
jgi:hypothetical protein